MMDSRKKAQKAQKESNHFSFCIFCALLRPLFMMIALVFLSIASAADISEPARVVREKIDQTMVILRDPGMQTEASLPEMRRRLIATLEPLFTFREMTVRALGAHARKLKPDQIDTLAASFRKLLERVYIDRLTAHLVASDNPYTVEAIDITGEEMRGGFSKILTEATISRGTEKTQLLINYRMARREGRWLVYDIEIEGVSLIENYRTQFNEILTSKTFDDLLQTINQNVAALEKESAPKPKAVKVKARPKKHEETGRK